MELADLISAERVILDVDADCSKAVFRCVSGYLSPLTDIPARDIANALTERERMGSTAVGDGVSIPHARLEQVSAPQAFMLRLNKPIDMDADDDQLVNIFFILLVPQESNNEHLRMLSKLARVIRAPGNLEFIRSSHDPAAVAELLQNA